MISYPETLPMDPRHGVDARRAGIAARPSLLLLGLLVGLLCGLFGAADSASAHALDPSLLELEEISLDSGVGLVDVTWRAALATFDGTRPEPVLPCQSEGPETQEVTTDRRALIRRWRLRCSGDELAAQTAGHRSILAGSSVEVTGLDPRATEVLVRWTRIGGDTLHLLLDPRAPETTLPEAPSPADVAFDYLGLGFGHILEGFDHLAFVFGLFLLVVGGRRLVATITAFTVGHSLTLALVVLGAFVPPSALVEAAIAASILVLAVELARRRTTPSALLHADLALESPKTTEASWLRRYPWSMAGAFGLLHGLGFAGALRETGLPQGEIPLALVGFNLGIELGQLAFVVSLVVAGSVLRWLARAGFSRLSQPVPCQALGRTLAVYSLGALAAYWTLERMGGVLF